VRKQKITRTAPRVAIFRQGSRTLRRGWHCLISEDDVRELVAGPTIVFTVKKNVFMIWGTDT
jgi:hypothetical protein